MRYVLKGGRRLQQRRLSQGRISVNKHECRSETILYHEAYQADTLPKCSGEGVQDIHCRV
jgi:hypothetical protein